MLSSLHATPSHQKHLSEEIGARYRSAHKSQVAASFKGSFNHLSFS